MTLSLVGRDSDLERCLRLLDPGRPGILVIGEPGVGKSRFLAELSDRLRATGRRIVTLAPKPADAAEPPSAAAIWKRQRELVGPEPASSLIVADDLHMLDEVSLRALQGAHRASGVPVLAATTPERAAHGDVMELWKDGGLDRFVLGPLPEHACRGLAADLAERPLSPEEAARAWELCSGNPRDLEDLILGAGAAGQLSGGAVAPFSPLTENAQVMRRLDTRLEGVEPEHLVAYDMVAFADGLPAEAFEAQVGTQVVMALEQSGLIVVDSDARPARPLEGEARASALDDERASHVAGEILDCLSTIPVSDREDLVRRVEWEVMAGREPDDEALIHAGWAALLRFGTHRARSLAAAAAPSGERDALIGHISWLEGARMIADDAPAPTKTSSGLDRISAALARGLFGSDPGGALHLATQVERIVATTPALPSGPVAISLCAQSWAWWVTGRIDEYISRLGDWRRSYAGIALQLDTARAGCLALTESPAAPALLEESIDRLWSHDPLGQLPWALSALAEYRLRRGELDLAGEALRGLERLSPQWRMIAAEQHRVRALVALYGGARREGEQELLAALQIAEDLDKPAFSARLLEDRLRFGWLEEADRAAQALIAELDRPWSQLAALGRFASAAASSDAGGLHAASSDLLAGGWTLLAAEAAAVGSAAALKRDGDRARAHGLAVRSQRIAAAFPDVRTPSLDMAVPVISARETEVAHAAATGLSSPRIARIKRLSGRTVENHLNSAYKKLGIHGREDLKQIYDANLGDLPPELRTPATE